MPIFQCLFLLESTDFFILEIKRTDIPENSPPADRFKWLRIEKEKSVVASLNFRSMDSSGEIEERFFDEGFLKFDSSEGAFIEKFNKAQHSLKRLASVSLEESIVNCISQYLTEFDLKP